MENQYKQMLKGYVHDLKKLKKRLDLVSNIRLLILLITVTMIFYSYFYINILTSWIALIIGVVSFISMVILHGRLNWKYRYLSALCDINKKNIDRLQGKWVDFVDDGGDFLNPEHEFSWDLDLFGKGSLFQWINTCSTPTGKNRLKESLINPLKDKDEIYKRQGAIKELSGKLIWRQKVNALVMMLDNKSLMDKDLQIPNGFYSKKIANIVINLLPALTILSGASLYLNFVNQWPFFLLITLQFLITIVGFGKRGKVLNGLFSLSDNLNTYTSILNDFEKQKFKENLNLELQQKLRNANNVPSSLIIKRLSKIADRAANRNNLFFFPINVILLWDLRCMIQYEAWKKGSNNVLEKIEEVIGELEALNSFAQLTYDQQQWTFPTISANKKHIRARQMSHPLIIPEGVPNDIDVNQENPMLLITGSNMSGKSTLLRAIGINLVLCYAGGPVCATSFETSIFDLHTCMRISDNLEKGISSFYGELLRIKDMIISSKNANITKLVLLDEIFKGTNSYDRHIGAKALAKQLLEQGACGLISTHDLELEVLETETQGMVKNYHFKEHYVNDEIKFDYTLRRGVSKTRNALYLLRLVGIDLK